MTPNHPENPRMLLAAFIEDRLGNHGRTRNGPLARFLGAIQAGLKLTDAEMVSYRTLVYHVRCGRKCVPHGAEDVWGRALGLVAGTIPWLEYHKLVNASRAWGKADGREHYEALELENSRLEAANRALKAENARLSRIVAGNARRLTDSEMALEAIKARLPKPGDEPEVVREDNPERRGKG